MNNLIEMREVLQLMTMIFLFLDNTTQIKEKKRSYIHSIELA